MLNTSGWIHIWRGEFNAARDELTRAIRLSPLDPLLNMFRGGLALALAFGEPPELQRALDLTDKVLEISPDDFLGMQQRIPILVMLGRVDEAREVAQHLLSVAPNSSISRFRRRYPHRKEVADRVLSPMRAAGIPE